MNDIFTSLADSIKNDKKSTSLSNEYIKQQNSFINPNLILDGNLASGQLWDGLIVGESVLNEAHNYLKIEPNTWTPKNEQCYIDGWKKRVKNLSPSDALAKYKYLYKKRFEKFADRIISIPEQCLYLNKALEWLDIEIIRLQKVVDKEKEELNLSVPDWALVFYYADTAKLLPDAKSTAMKLRRFKETHSIDATETSFFNKFYDMRKKLKKIDESMLERLDDIMPTIKKYYPKSVVLIQNEKVFIKAEITERQQVEF